MQTAGIEIIQPHINRLRRRARLHALIDILHDVAKPQARPILAIEQRQLGPIIIGLEFGKRWQGGAHGFSSEQPGIEGEWHGLADFDFGKIGMRRIDEVVGFAGDDAWQGEQRGAGVFRPRITDLLGGV